MIKKRNNSSSWINFIFVILFTALNIPLFAQDNSASLPDTTVNPSINTNTGDKKVLLLGFHVAFGLNRNSSGIFTDGNNEINLSMAGAMNVQFFFTKNIGISFDIGAQQFKVKETDNLSTTYHEFTLKYLYIGMMPIFKFNGIYVGFGVYMGFILNVEYDGNDPSISSDKNNYTMPDIGFLFKAGYEFSLSKNIDMFAGVEVKSMVTGFYASYGYTGKVFSAYITLGMLFGIK